MPEPTRLPIGGLSLASADAPYGLVGNAFDPSQWVSVFDDFTPYRAADWTVAIGTGGTIAAAAGENGIVALNTGATASNPVSLTANPANFKFGVGKLSVFTFQGTFADIAGPGFSFGVFSATDFLLLQKSATIANALALSLTTASVSQFVKSIPLSAALANGSHRFSVVYNPRDQVFRVFVDDDQVGGQALGSGTLPTTNIPPFISLTQGGTGAKTLDLDFVHFLRQR